VQNILKNSIRIVIKLVGVLLSQRTCLSNDESCYMIQLSVNLSGVQMIGGSYPNALQVASILGRV